MKINKFYKLMSCMLIWMQILSCICFADQSSRAVKKEFLSPKLSLNRDSFQESIKAYSKAKVEQALKITAKNIDDIGQRNFERVLSPRELVVALAMVLEGKSLRYIDGHFDSLNYLLEEFGIKRKPKQIKRIRTLRRISILFFAVSFAFGLTSLDLINQRYHIGHLISAPIFLFFAWYFIGWVVDFFSWVEKKIDPRNKHVFDDPVNNLNEQEKKEFLEKIESTMRDVINNRFDEPFETEAKARNPYTYETSRVLESGKSISSVAGSFQFSKMVFSAI